MIIGNGFLAHSFNHYKESENIIIFAAGVSNSQDMHQNSFEREKQLLSQTLEVYSGKKIVYFGTCSIYDLDIIESPYVQHKIAMEKLVAEYSNYQIFRLPIIAGHSKNPHTLLNFLYNKVLTESSFSLWEHATRNIVDIDFVKTVCSMFIDQDMYLNSATNIAVPKQTALIVIVKAFENILNKKAHYIPINRGCKYTIPILELSSLLNKELFENYNIEDILRKYFSDNKLGIT